MAGQRVSPSQREAGEQPARGGRQAEEERHHGDSQEQADYLLECVHRCDVLVRDWRNLVPTENFRATAMVPVAGLVWPGTFSRRSRQGGLDAQAGDHPAGLLNATPRMSIGTSRIVLNRDDSPGTSTHSFRHAEHPAPEDGGAH